MIYVEPRAGLCNRMRVIASAYHLAVKYKTEITVLWRVSKGLGCPYFNLFRPDPMIQIIETHYKFSIKFLSKALKCEKKFYNIKVDALGKIEECLIQNKDIYINTVFWFYDVGTYEMFIPINTIEKQISNICKEYLENTIGLHIRRTDNVESIKHSSLELFIDFINQKIKEDTNVKFFLATDCKETEKELIKKYGHYIIVNKNKILERKKQKGIEDALVDLGCLSNCKCIAGSYYSSFSEIAAQWKEKKELYILSDL